LIIFGSFSRQIVSLLLISTIERTVSSTMKSGGNIMKPYLNKTKWPVCVSILVLAGAIFGYALSTGAASASPPAADVQLVASVPMDFNRLAQAVRPGVVNIQTVKTIKGGGPVFRHFFEDGFRGRHPFEEFFGPFTRRQPRDFRQQSLARASLSVKTAIS
jgi:S1-C subfamily serine protease